MTEQEKQAYEKGIQAGIAQAKEQFYTAGYNQGFADGYQKGHADGLVEGLANAGF